MKKNNTSMTKITVFLIFLIVLVVGYYSYLWEKAGQNSRRPLCQRWIRHSPEI